MVAIAPPQAPIERIMNLSGLGLNITSRTVTEDVIIQGTGDSGVLFQKDAGGSTLRRAQLSDIALGNSETYGKHAIYGKAPDLLIEDITAECSFHCASGFSMRFDGATIRRFLVAGAPHALTYYETSFKKGNVLFEDGDGEFSADTGVWIDIEGSAGLPTSVIQDFTFRRVNLRGDGVFLKVSSKFAGSVTIDSCTLNGHPVTKDDVWNVTAKFVTTPAQPTNAQLRDAAIAEAKQTTVGYINTHWKTPPSGTHWKNLLDILAKIK